MNITHITILAQELDLGESLRSECPECESKDQTLSVTHSTDGTILYQCFRASCDCRGKIGGTGVHKQTVAKPKRKTFEGKTVPLPSEVATWIERKWGIKEPPYWYLTEEYGGRIAMSIRSPYDTHRGWVLRNDGSQMPKALTYLNENEEQLSWYFSSNPSVPTVLVEDIPSAARAATYINAVALLGTTVSETKAAEIREHAKGRIVIALDQDAVDQAMALAKKYRLIWDNPMVLPLKQDLKDMGEAELCQLLSRFKNQS